MNGDVVSINFGDSIVLNAKFHHSLVDFILKFYVPNVINQPKNLPYQSFNKCNYNDIYNFLINIHFKLILEHTPFEDSIKKFYKIINHSFSIFVSKITIIENYSPLWTNKNLKNLIFFTRSKFVSYIEDNIQVNFFWKYKNKK